MLRVAVVADTHLRWTSKRQLPHRVHDLAEQADLILHAGDVLDGRVLAELGAHAPVHAVLGNNDRDLVGELPETLALDLEGVRVAMIHDAGPAKGRERRMRRRFPDADLVVFGHSHIPWNTPEPDGDGGSDQQILFNPGSPTQRRRQPHHTAGVLVLDDGAVIERRIVIVDPSQ